MSNWLRNTYYSFLSFLTNDFRSQIFVDHSTVTRLWSLIWKDFKVSSENSEVFIPMMTKHVCICDFYE